jgi:transposase
MAQECVSLIPGIKELLADKGYDTNAFRAFLKDQKIKPVIPTRAETTASAAGREHGRAVECRSSSGRTEAPAEAVQELWIIAVFFYRAYLERVTIATPRANQRPWRKPTCSAFQVH